MTGVQTCALPISLKVRATDSNSVVASICCTETVDNWILFDVGEKKPRAARKPKVVSDATAETSLGNIDEPAITKKPVKAKASRTVSDTEKVDKVASVKKVKDVKATSSSDASTKSPKVKTTKLTLGATEKSIKDDFEGNDMFDLKELLGDDFLSEGEGLGLLPNLDEDLAKLEANLNELGDFGFDFRDDEDDDEALRSIESGKFDIEDFLKEKDGADEVDDLDLSSLLSDLGGKKGGSESLTIPGGKAKKVAEPNKKKKEKAVQPTLQQAMKGVQEDEDDDDEGLEDESVSDQVLEELALSLGLGGDDLMDVSRNMNLSVPSDSRHEHLCHQPLVMLPQYLPGVLEVEFNTHTTYLITGRF